LHLLPRVVFDYLPATRDSALLALNHAACKWAPGFRDPTRLEWTDNVLRHIDDPRQLTLAAVTTGVVSFEGRGTRFTVEQVRETLFRSSK
jgi:hypothetical protein